MRRDPTRAERKLWQALRKHQAHGLKFRRQVPLGPYIADFYCAAVKLVVELDGISHLDAAGDAIRDDWMHRHGLRVLRIPNLAVFRNLEGIVVAIEQIAGAPPPPNPLPQGEGESSIGISSTSSTAIAAMYLDV
jgi:very-short-patch-repair endonuclease